jgi:ABC-type Fe3+-hydroxamate transport system substrate-binding protein
LGDVASPAVVSWTGFDPTHNVYTVYSDNYYTQLAQDAGAVLRAPNKLQENSFDSKSPVTLFQLAQAIQSADYLIDKSQPSLTYDTWLSNGGLYFTPNNSYTHVNAIANNKVYTYNGLVSANNVSGKLRGYYGK